MARVKLQYSIIYQQDARQGLLNFIHGFPPGKTSFYVSNKWIWDDHNYLEDGFYQETSILKNGQPIAVSRSEFFNVKLSHTHHNYFEGIVFTKEADYRIRVTLFNKQGEMVKEASLEYPLFIR